MNKPTVRYRDLTPEIIDSDTSDSEDSSDSDVDSDDEISNTGHSVIPELAPEEEVDAFDGDAFVISSEVEITAVELRDLLSDKPLQVAASRPVLAKAPVTTTDEAPVVWAFES